MYVNKILNYGLHKTQIEIQSPDVDLTNRKEDKDQKKHYFLGERYVNDSQIDKEKVDPEDNSYISDGSKIMVAYPKDNGTIFDKSNQNKQSVSSKNATDEESEKIVEEIAGENENTEIDENDNYYEDSDGNYVLARGFDPENNKESRFYTENFETSQEAKKKQLSIYNESNVSKMSLSNFGPLDVSATHEKTSIKGAITSRNVNINAGKVFLTEDDIGSSPWDNNNWDNSIKTNVDAQDDMTYDDIEGASDVGNLGTALAGTGKNLVDNLGVVKGIKKIAGGEDRLPEVPRGTSLDYKFSLLKAIKSKKFKNVKMSSKLGTYNSLYNLLGFASGMFVGSLGKSMISNLADDMTSKFTGGFGVAGMIERLGGALEAMPSAEELVALNLANYYNMYTARPGRIVTDRYHKYNFITPNLTDDIDGSRLSKEGVLEKIQKVTNYISNGMNLASSWVDGSKLSELAGKIGKKKPNWLVEFGIESQMAKGGAYIISNKRKVKEIDIKDKLSEAKNLIDALYNNGSDGAFKRIKKEGANILGGLYIEPYYNPEKDNAEDEEEKKALECFEIPFQFNPEISDGGYEAKYQVEELAGRLLSVRSYIGTNSSNVTLETKYMITRDDNYVNNMPGAANGKQFSKESSMEDWMQDWTPERIAEIERQYRKLVFPYINSKTGVFVRPPIIRIRIGDLGRSFEKIVELEGPGNEEGKKATTTEKINTMSDLFSYPNIEGAIQVTGTLEGWTNEKRYIATNLSINPIDDNFWYYINGENKPGSASSFYRGFKVTLTLTETTKNFLDVIPNYMHYSKKPHYSVAVLNPTVSHPALPSKNSTPDPYNIFKPISNFDDLDKDYTTEIEKNGDEETKPWFVEAYGGDKKKKDETKSNNKETKNAMEGDPRYKS